MSAPSIVEQPDHNEPVPLQYVNAAPLSRRHFRLLLFLTLLNSFLIVGGFVAAPFIQESTKQFWHDFQERRIQQRAGKAFQATYQQAKNFTLPGGTVVYDEDPQRAAALSAAGGYRNSDANSYTYITPRPWQLPVLRNPPARLYNNVRHLTHITWTKGDTWEQGKVDVTTSGLLRVFAGQSDPNDSTHFTITYEYDGKAGTIDGRLRDDDTVALDLKPAHLHQKNPSQNEAVWDLDPQGGE